MSLANPSARTDADSAGPSYIVYCVVLFVSLFVIFFKFPETRGRSLEEVSLATHPSSDWANLAEH